MLSPYRTAQVSFRNIREIGLTGRNSKTYVSYDPQLDVEIVTKQIAKSTLNSATNFFDESKALYASAHPNVVQIHYACEDTDNIYLAMPYYRKGSVAELLATQHVTVREIVTIGCQIISGLHNIHSKGLIHFDVKPDNILRSDRGEALVSDFGLAKQMNFMGIAFNDRLYNKMIPPEATRSNNFNRAFDIYQLGLTFYRMCNGDVHFNMQYARYGVGAAFDRNRFRDDLRNGVFPDRDAFAAHIPINLRRIIKKCLEITAVDRYPSAIDAANALADIEGPILDWRLTEVPGTRSWVKNENGTILEFSAAASGATQCFKTISGGQRRRVSDGCQPKMTDAKIRTFLGAL